MPLYVQDKRLTLPDGRTLAYADNGNTSSTTIVLFLHSTFQVGNASHIPLPLERRHAHLITPTLPGWGESTPIPNPSQYARAFIDDMTVLLTHLHPGDKDYKMYIVGHSFGCVPAQVLYGASYDMFPFGRRTAALVLLAPLSPPHCHKDYYKHLPWNSYFLAGPPSQYIPFSLHAHLIKLPLAKHLRTERSAETYVRKTLFDGISDAERETFALWREEHGMEDDGKFEREWGQNAARSVARSWRGFVDIPAIYHSGWGGFDPGKLDSDHAKPPVIIVASTRDPQVPAEMARWLARAYTGSQLKVVEGSHISALFHLDEVLEELLGS